MKTLLTLSMVLGTVLLFEQSAQAWPFGSRESCCKTNCCKPTCCESSCCPSSSWFPYHGGGVWWW